MKHVLIYGGLFASGFLSGSPSLFAGLLPLLGVVIAYLCGIALGRSL